ncbi:MAG: hypothetical protein RML84_09165 [Anaerolineae bacterium]|nr:hypothetical protein [Anaerolineae bacterium]
MTTLDLINELERRLNALARRYDVRDGNTEHVRAWAEINVAITSLQRLRGLATTISLEAEEVGDERNHSAA